ncbi:Autophagy-related protein 8h [Ranunculus cassubicifolius]
MRKTTKSFKDEYSFEAAKWKENSLMVIAERYSSSDLPEMEKKKYLVPRDMSIGHFIHILSLRLGLSPGKALFVFVNNTLPQTASLMDSLYGSFKDEDGFLYMCYSTEKTFG